MGRKILEPIKIKSMELKNRIGFGPFLGPPHTEDYGVGEDTIRWFEKVAKGGVGFILIGATNPAFSTYEEARKMPPMGGLGLGLTIHDDKYIPGFAKLAEVMHSYGVKVGLQIAVGGVSIGASPSPYPKKDFIEVMMGMQIPTREVSVEEIEQITSDTAQAAGRAKAAGIDCVGLHCAHGYVSLWGAFMSPFSNMRTDKYGGSWENRLRFSVETIQAMREVVGEDYPILVRLSADELFGEMGVTIEDTCKYIIPTLEETGVDCFDITMGSQLHNPNNIPPMYVPRGYFMYLPEAVKKVTQKPVIGVGRILDMDMAERFLEEGKADIIYMARQLIADPETPKKYFEGKTEDIRKCIGDLPGFGDCVGNCTVNPMGVATDEVTPAEKSKKVLIIGGGVGGMEAARIAALRGHKVTLVEKDTELGGMVSALARTSLTAEFGNIVDYLSTQMRKLRVDVRICREFTPEEVGEFGPDVVIVATGSSMLIPEVALGKPGVMDHIEAMRRERKIGQKVVIAGLIAGELAISLAEEGKDVTIFGRGTVDRLSKDAPLLRRWFLVKRLTDVDIAEGDGDIPLTRKDNPKVLYGLNLDDVTTEGVVVVNKEGKKKVFPYDTFIISLNRKSNNSFFEALEGKVPELYQIGDCVKVGEIVDAIKAANEVARKI